MTRPFVLLTCLLPSLLGCHATLTKMAANLTGDVVEVATPKLYAHWDVDLFGDGLPGLVLLMEGVVATSPDNNDARLELAKAYCMYSYAWLENEYEIEETKGNFDEADTIRNRTKNLYLRARDMGLHIMRDRNDEIDEAMKDAASLRAHLQEEYTSKDDVALLFWTGMAWGSAINIGRDDPMLIADLGTVKVFAERAMELDETYFFGAPLALMGAIEGGLPKALGGKPKIGRQMFERALAVTDRRNAILMVQYARTYALTVGDRELYEKLLKEALAAPDPGDDLRLSNEIAKRRAERYLANIDMDM